MSVFHRIADVSVMRSTVFLRLVTRLAAYNGAVAARIAAERRERAEGSGGRSRVVRQSPRYERGSAKANNARMADEAPPATADALAAANAALGAEWFKVRTADGNGQGG